VPPSIAFLLLINLQSK